nr:hypothetical protein [Rhizobium jaguaris]
MTDEDLQLIFAPGSSLDLACSVDLLVAASEFLALTLAQTRTVIKDVATVTAIWPDMAKAVGARAAGSTAWPALSSMTISNGL